jgi:hypothetical protein
MGKKKKKKKLEFPNMEKLFLIDGYQRFCYWINDIFGWVSNMSWQILKKIWRKMKVFFGGGWGGGRGG